MEISMEKLAEQLEREGYITEENVVTTIYLSLKLQKPLLVEGAPGVGKTEIAKVLSIILDTDLIRLQCYEGLDETKALYEWNYQKQLLKIQIMKDQVSPEEIEKDLFAEDYLLNRPLLKAIRAQKRPVLLIDEVDRVEPEFEAFLFEVLSDFQVSIPELGTITATHTPVVVLTSNADRELSDALKRRCIYMYIDYPDIDKEKQILSVKASEAGEQLCRQVASIVNYIRDNLHLRKKPSIAETIDWARALAALNYDSLNEQHLEKTINILLKNHDDQLTVCKETGVSEILKESGVK